MTYSNIEKTAVVLNLMGDSFAEVILSKLPRDLVVLIQQSVVPIMSQVQMPPDIDAFVLDEIIRDNSVVEPTIEEAIVSDPLDPSKRMDPSWDPSICDDEALLCFVPAEIALRVLLSENRVFQGVLLDFFPEEQRKLMLQILSEKNMQIPQSTGVNPFIAKMELSMKQAFLAKLRIEAGQEINRE
jgi:hypothetical protein